MKYFTIQELTATSTGISNTPNAGQLKNLEFLVDNILDPVRERIGMPIMVTSGFRNISVNTRVGGARNSQHCTGEAADLVCADNTLLFNAIKEMGVFDQLIWEKGNDNTPAWVHVSVKKSGGNRKQVLRIR